MTGRSVLLSVFIRGLYPAILVASVWILLRGHNEPGGGFVGGMLAVAATAALAVASGATQAIARLPLTPTQLASVGVLLALCSGLPGTLSGHPYMTHLWTVLPLGITTVDISTVLLFDVGVYLTVWGALGGLAAHAIGLDEESA